MRLRRKELGSKEAINGIRMKKSRKTIRRRSSRRTKRRSRKRRKAKKVIMRNKNKRRYWKKDDWQGGDSIGERKSSKIDGKS